MQIIWKPSPNYSGNMGSKSVIVCHWWDKKEKRPSLSGTVSWLCNPAAKVSAHYVVSDRTVYQLVAEDKVAWHAMSANSFSIGIEVDPNTPGATYDTLIQLIKEIATRHLMSLPSAIKAHRDYVQTECPGDLDLARIRRGALEQGGIDVSKEEAFSRVFIAIAQRWPNKQEQDAWQKSGMEDYSWCQRYAPNPVVNDRVALEIYHQARLDAGGGKWEDGRPYPATQFSTDRLNGGANFQKVMKGDMAYYLAKEKLANELLSKDVPAPVSAEDKKDIELGRAFRAVSKEAIG